MKKLMLLVFLVAATLSAGEKKLMHCFAFTAVEGATDADWQAFFKATDELPGKIPAISRVWYGKLRNPLAQFVPDAKTRKELSGGAKTATGEVSRLVRQWGVCMEMTDTDALASYAKTPAHDEWVKVYSKVRVPGTTTYDIIGQ
jgi:hypothetical protein